MSLYLTISQLLAFIPSVVGVLLRRVWYKMTLTSCGRGLVVDWMGVIKTTKARIGNNVYVGVYSWVGECEIGNDTMISGMVMVLSGGHHHATSKNKPMRLQGGNPHSISIGKDCWVGVHATIMNDVADGTVIGSGAVVTKVYEPYSILAGVPARIIGQRK